MKIEALRSSLLHLWGTCPLQVWMAKTHGWARPSGAQFTGTCAHHAVEVNFRQKIESKEDIPEPEFLGAFEETFDRNKDPFDDRVPDWKGEDRGAIKDAFLGSKATSSSVGKTPDRRGILHLFHTGVSPVYQPVGVERHVEALVPVLNHKGKEFKVTGIIDFQGDHLAPGKKRSVVADWKFRKRGKGDDEAKKSDQLTTYSWLSRESGIKLQQLEQVVSVFGVKEPRVDTQITKRTRADEARVKKEYQRMWMQLELLGDNPEHYPMIARDAWQCSEQWCGWWRKCPRGGGDFYRSAKVLRKQGVA
jgi:hypothetical protein